MGADMFAGSDSEWLDGGVGTAVHKARKRRRKRRQSVDPYAYRHPDPKNRSDRRRFNEIKHSTVVVAGSLDTGCWENREGQTAPGIYLNKRQGYFFMRYEGMVWPVHRWMLAIKMGRPFMYREQARHLCHNRACCRPSHLVPGYPADNMRDNRWKSEEYALSARGLQRTSLVHAHAFKGTSGKLEFPNPHPVGRPPLWDEKTATVLDQIEATGHSEWKPRPIDQFSHRPSGSAKRMSRSNGTRIGNSPGFLSLENPLDVIDQDRLEHGPGVASKLPPPSAAIPEHIGRTMLVLQLHGWTRSEIADAFNTTPSLVSRACIRCSLVYGLAEPYR